MVASSDKRPAPCLGTIVSPQIVSADAACLVDRSSCARFVGRVHEGPAAWAGIKRAAVGIAQPYKGSDANWSEAQLALRIATSRLEIVRREAGVRQLTSGSDLVARLHTN